MSRKVILITGATSGIGEEIARRCSQEKFDLILVGRNQRKLSSLKKEFETNKFSPNITTIKLDLSRKESANELFEKLDKKALKPDIVINNAGFGIYDEVSNYDNEKLHEMITLNISTLTQICTLFCKNLKESSNEGQIINVASTGAFQPLPYLSAYGASKSYVLYFSQALQEEVREFGISISTLCPGPTKTKFEERADPQKKSFFKKDSTMTPREVAEICYTQCILKNKPIVVCGNQNKFGSIIGTLLPKSLSAKFVATQLKKN